MALTTNNPKKDGSLEIKIKLKENQIIVIFVNYQGNGKMENGMQKILEESKK